MQGVWKNHDFRPIPRFISDDAITLFADDTNLFIFSNIVEDPQVDAMDKILLLNNWFVAKSRQDLL